MRFFCLLLFITVTLYGYDADRPSKKIYFIINPISGGVKKKDLESQIQSQFKSWDIEIAYTQAQGHATELAKQAALKEIPIIAVAGGDGTINEVAQALVGSKSALAILPTGSGNGLALHLNIPEEIDKAIQVIKTGHTETIDTVKVNDRSYLCVAGIGFDAEIGWAFSEFGHRGFLSYLLLTLKKLPKYEPKIYELTIDGKEISREAFLIAFANSSQFGNDAYIAPTAEIDDGFVDVIIMKKVPFYATAHVVHQLFNKSLDNSRYVEIIKGKDIKVIQKDIKAHVDGEPVFYPDGMHLEVIPASLKVVVP